MKPSRLRGREGGEVEVNRDCSECLLSTGAWSNGCCLLPSTQTLRCAGAGWWERFGIAVLSIVSDEGVVPLLRWGLDPRDPTDHYSDLLPCPHLQDTTSGYLGPKSTFSPSCYCPWLGLKSFPRKKWTVSDLGGCLRDEGRLQERDGEVCRSGVALAAFKEGVLTDTHEAHPGRAGLGCAQGPIVSRPHS